MTGRGTRESCTLVLTQRAARVRSDGGNPSLFRHAVRLPIQPWSLREIVFELWRRTVAWKACVLARRTEIQSEGRCPILRANKL
jgi:hypothetical protein